MTQTLGADPSTNPDVTVTFAARTNSKVYALEPRDGVDIVFKDLHVEVVDSKSKLPRKLLDGVSGLLLHGQMTALMGPSGSGKTTLLDVLSGRKSSGKLSGSVLYGGSAPTKANLQALAGYVEQQPTLIAVFTVREMLVYTAKLKRPWREPRHTMMAVVDALIQDLQLESCAHVIIGDPMVKGISGGQAKRVSIGAAMVCVPPVLFLDEPTSGLDSQSAYEILSLVRKAALDGVNVIVAIHSPGPELFALFERVQVLAMGHIFYSGGTGEYYCNAFKLSAQPWLEGIRDNTAFADVLLKAAATASVRDNVRQLREAVSACKDPGVLNSDSSMRGRPTTSQQAARPMNPSWYHLYLLLRHRAVRNWTVPFWVFSRLADKLIMAAIMVTLLYGQGAETTPEYLMNLSAGLYMCAVVPTFSAWGYTPVLIIERPLYYREVADGLYGAFAYLTYKALEEILALIPLSLIFTPVVFFVIKYQGSFVLFWLTYLATFSCSVLLAFAVSSVSRSQDIASLLVTLYTLACFFSAGQIATLSTLPIYWTWISRVNFVRYAWSALMLNQFGGHDPVFTTDDKTVLQFYHVSGNKWQNLGFVCIFIAVLLFLGWLGLRLVHHQKR